jgi:penicillin amidase
VKSLKKFFVRLFLVTPLLVLACVAAVYFILSRSLPQLDGVAGDLPISAEVTIERDAYGIPTIIAGNRSDLAFATGYVHGQDRFFQMDLMRRQAAGELAALAGPAAIEVDKATRIHRFRERAREVLAISTPAEAEVIEAYTAGVNAGLSSLAAQPFEYHLLRASPHPWRGEDSILVALAMFLELNDELAARDVQRALVHDVLPQSVFDWMYPEGTEWDAPLLGESRAGPPLPLAGEFNIRERAVVASASTPEVAEEYLPGSNNWAVSGRLTQSGSAIVSNDMHLNIRVPNVFYRARLVVRGAEERDVSGVTLPGAPVVITGSNGRVAWGFTNSYGDWSDAVVLQPGREPGTYLTPGGPRHFSVHQEVIEVRGGEPVTLEVRETIWGPVLEDSPYPFNEIAVSWIAHSAEAVNLGHLALENVNTVSEAIAAANRLGIPPQNFVCGDAQGNIGWTIAGRIPRRTEYDAFLPADWSTVDGWRGWLSPDEYPRLINPPDGRIWTANARVTDGEDLRKIRDGGYDLGARAKQIRDGLYAQQTFDPQSMLPIQTDDRALFLERWRDLLLSVLDEETVRDAEGRREYRRLVENWTPRASADSTGYRLVRAFRSAVRSRVFEMLTDPVREVYGDDIDLRISNQFEGPLWTLVTERPMHLLAADYIDWKHLLVDVVDQNVAYFADNFRGPLAERTWGERNSAAIRHPLSPALPQLSRWLDMPEVPLDGDSNMPRAQGPSFGASERFAVSPGNEENGYMHMPTGQSGHPLSDFYRRGHDDWVSGRSSGFLPGPTAHTLVLLPDRPQAE